MQWRQVRFERRLFPQASMQMRLGIWTERGVFGGPYMTGIFGQLGNLGSAVGPPSL
jgi:hypothetical protein